LGTGLAIANTIASRSIRRTATADTAPGRKRRPARQRPAASLGRTATGACSCATRAPPGRVEVLRAGVEGAATVAHDHVVDTLGQQVVRALRITRRAPDRLRPRPRAAPCARDVRSGATIRSMTLVDSQQQGMLERLRRAGDQPVALAELRAGGIDFPATVVSQLELNGYAIERVYDHGRLVGIRLVGPQPPDQPAARRRYRWPWRTGSKRRTS
jgi:hypothetical protein